jgi:uncharacterized protein YodC (DUF2158 family)
MRAIGTRVMLKSGGPSMLVVDYEDDQLVCAWKTEDHNTSEDIFPDVCVTDWPFRPAEDGS